MSEANKSEDLWSPFKELQRIVLKQLSSKQECSSEFETALRKHKQNFFSLLQNPPKNAKSRDELKKCMQEGISLKQIGHQVLTKELYQEAIILSDMFDMNEFVALDLLCMAQLQSPHHPGLPRGLVAILLYYDGRKAVVSTLRYLVQARSGVQWTADVAPDVEKFVNVYTNQLMEGGLFNKIFELLCSLDLSKEIENLQQNLALGGPKHRRQVIHLFNEIKYILADTVFIWSAQTGLTKDVTIMLINHLRKANIEEEASGKIDDVNMLLQMAFLYAVDLSILHNREDGEDAVKNLPILSDPDFIRTVLNELVPSVVDWECKGLQAITTFGVAICLASLRLIPQNSQFQDIIIKDELIVDAVVEIKLFEFLHNIFFENETIYKEKFIYQRIHYLFTDFIVYMYPKVKELRIRADDNSKNVQNYMREGLDAPPTDVAKPFEYLLLAIAKFYGRDQLSTNYVLDYWSPIEINPNQTYSYQAPPRAVSLFKFVRLVGDMVPKNLFVPFVTMLSSLSSTSQSARHCFNLLKLGTQLSATLTWDHFFQSFNQYYGFLRQEAPVGDTIYRQRTMYQKGVQPHEIEGLHAVLLLIRTVAEHDEFSRLALCEHPGWAPLTVLLGLVGCPIPQSLKSDLLLTLASLSKSAENAAQMWENLESSQILVTVPSTSSYQSRGIQTELEEVESRIEEYPLTRAFLSLLDVLTDIGIPRTLGAGPRKPGFDPYLSYVIDSIFCKYSSRSYKNPLEKWSVANLCLKLFEKFLNQYNPQLNDFQLINEFNPPPAYHIMVQMSNRSNMLQVILDILSEGVSYFDMYITSPADDLLMKCTLKSLNILNKVLFHQAKFIALMASLPSQPVIFSSLTKILLHDMNPKTCRPDYALNIGKYVSYQTLYPDHPLVAIKILIDLTSFPKNHSSFINHLFCAENVNNVIRNGFVECLDTPEEENELTTDVKIEIIKLLKQCLPYNAPNFSHYLLGFDIKNDISKTEFQHAGVLEYPRSCLHSLVSLTTSAIVSEIGPPARILESSFHLLYLLASNRKTSSPVLRFLRSVPNFFKHHLSLAVRNINKGNDEFNQVSWLLRTLAVELKVLNTTKQVTYMKQLTNFLVGLPTVQLATVDPFQQTLNKHDITVDHSKNPESLRRKLPGGELVFTQANAIQNDNLMTKLIPYFEVNISQIEMPNWEFFDKNVLTNILNQCKTAVKPNLIDLKKLHQVLYDELKCLQGTAGLAQIQAISQEIPKVLRYSLELNEYTESSEAVVRFVDSWRQVIQVISLYVPVEVLTFKEQELLSVQITMSILKIIVKTLFLQEVYSYLSGTILILLMNLKKMYLKERRLLKITKDDNEQENIDVLVMYHNILRDILSHIIEWIMVSDVKDEKLRVYQYATLVTFLQLVNVEKNTSQNLTKDSMYVSRLDSTKYCINDEDSQIHITVDILQSFGEKLVENLCQDCIGGHEVCRILAMSSFSLFISLTSNPNWLIYMSGRGYLKHIIQSILDGEDKLAEAIQPSPTSIKPLYLYLSKLALLCRLAGTRIGAEILLEQKILPCFSNMRVFSRHPEISRVWNKDEMLDDSIITVEKRYLQIIFPTFDLCNAILTTLGTDNKSAVVQVMHFILSHLDVVELILRSGCTTLSPLSLKELSLLTSVISRTANNDLINIMQNPEIHQNYRSQLHRIQKLMLSLIPKFIISETVVRELLSNPIDHENNFQTSERLLYAMQVMCNILSYARNIVANHGIDHSGAGVIFQPTLNDPLLNPVNKVNFTFNEEAPSLGSIVQQLLCAVNYQHHEKVTCDLLDRKKAEVPEMNSVDLREFIPESKCFYDTIAMRQYVYELVSDKLVKKKRELEYCTYVIENCLYLVWAHLDYYMLKAIPRAKNFGPPQMNLSMNLDQTLASSTEATWRVTTDDISNLKQGLVSVFNDSFCKRLSETAQDRSDLDKGFIEALLRKIKRLIQFVPVK